jgi:SAM-dependent methyltransferase
MRRMNIKGAIKTHLIWAATPIRWISNKVHKGPHSRWQKALPAEVAFWDKWLATGGLEWKDSFRKRTNPNAEVDSRIARFITSPAAKVIDVGAGPLTSIGTFWNGHRIEVVAVDPLADEYNRLLDKYRVPVSIRTQKLDAEQLTSNFSSNMFDLAYAANCLDHAYAPWLAIEQMLEITKPGGFVVLVHEVNEGANELYRGLHQWNFYQLDGDFMISAPGRNTINISKRLSSRADCSVEMDGIWLRFIAHKL